MLVAVEMLSILQRFLFAYEAPMSMLTSDLNGLKINLDDVFVPALSFLQ